MAWNAEAVTGAPENAPENALVIPSSAGGLFGNAVASVSITAQRNKQPSGSCRHRTIAQHSARAYGSGRRPAIAMLRKVNI